MPSVSTALEELPESPSRSLKRLGRVPLFVVAAVTAVALVLTLRRYEVSANGIAWCAVQLMLAFVAAWDLMTRRILNVVIGPAALVTLGLRLLFEHSALIESIVAGSIAFIVFLALSVAVRGGLGMGDVKFAGLIGLLLGRAAAGALIFGCFAGGVAAAALLLVGRAGRKGTFAYGPYLALGAGIWIVFGDPPPLI